MTPKVGQIYQHFKGAQYEIVDIVWDATGKELVKTIVYEALDDPRMRFSRSRDNFLEEVDRPEHNYKGPRFRLVTIPFDKE